MLVRQRATALHLIDKLALRVGNEKDTDEEADTVGCCTLRVEHLELLDGNRVRFDFLGKDRCVFERGRIVRSEKYAASMHVDKTMPSKGHDVCQSCVLTAVSNVC
jgi:DNA topoisomerase I